MLSASSQTRSSFIPSALLGAGFAAIVIALLVRFVLPEMPRFTDLPETKIFWYLSRTSGLAAYFLLWVSVAMGLLITSKSSRLWPGGPVAMEVHQYSSLLFLGFAAFHGLVLIGDQFTELTIVNLIVPFANENYRPGWVGVGQVAFYMAGVVALSWLVRRNMGRKAWRTLHFLSFVVFALALLHGIWAGTDTANPIVTGMYLATGTLTLLMLNYRILMGAGLKTKATPRVQYGSQDSDGPSG